MLAPILRIFLPAQHYVLPLPFFCGIKNGVSWVVSNSSRFIFLGRLLNTREAGAAKGYLTKGSLQRWFFLLREGKGFSAQR
jgi:hypothetical protein